MNELDNPMFTDEKLVEEIDALIKWAWDDKTPNEGRNILFDPSLGRTFEAIKHDILILQAKAKRPGYRRYVKIGY